MEKGRFSKQSGSLFVTASTCPDAVLAQSAIDGDFELPSIWSTSTPIGARLLICEALPNKEQMLGLFDIEDDIWVGGPA